MTTSPLSIARRSVLAAVGGLALSQLARPPHASAQVQTTKQPGDLPKRKLGQLEVSAVGLGVQNMHRAYTTLIPNRNEMLDIIREAFDRGVTFFDTAEVYGPHHCERILGEAIKGFRDEVVITSKFGFDVDLVTGERRGGRNSRPEHIKLAVDGMLERLGTDRIDMLYQHRVDPTVSIEDVAGTIATLVQEGKVLSWGLSEPGLETVRRAHAEHPVAAIQNEYSMMWRGPERHVMPLCEELGIGLVCWSPMAMGFLPGKVTSATRFPEGDFRGRVPRFSPENLEANMALYNLINTWAEEKSATPAQIALAWLLSRAPYVVPIPGTTRIDHMAENAGAAAISFSADELSVLDEQLDAIEVQGARLPGPVLDMTGVEAPLPG